MNNIFYIIQVTVDIKTKISRSRNWGVHNLILYNNILHV